MFKTLIDFVTGGTATPATSATSPMSADPVYCASAAPPPAVAADDGGQLAAVYQALSVAEFDLDGTVRLVNASFEHLLGQRAAALVGDHHQRLVHPTFRDSADYRSLWSELALGRPKTLTIKYLAPGGRALWTNSTFAPILGANGRPQRVIEFATDVTSQTALAEQLQTAVNATQTIVKQSIAGDLTVRIDASEMSGEVAKMVVDVNALLNARMVLVGRVKGLTLEVRDASQEIAKGNSTLSDITESQAASVVKTASSMEEMTSTVKLTADNAVTASQLATAAREQAESGGKVVTSAVDAMAQIRASSKKIEDIIGVIDEIAFQTNLLALNAAVEAARAGEQGRGFAVVASEVRSLAGRSATAAKQIKSLINDSVSKVQDGTRLVDESGKTLLNIVVAIKKVNDIVAEIAVSSREQSAGIEQVNKAIMQIDQATQQNAALVEETAAASQAIVDQMHSLHTVVGHYKTDPDPAAAVASLARRVA